MTEEQEHFKQIMQEEILSDEDNEDPSKRGNILSSQYNKKDKRIRIKIDETLKVYEELHHKKKKLLELVVREYNTKTLNLDIGLEEQFRNLRNIIDSQIKNIQRLKLQIAKQGLSGVNNDKELIRLKSKREEMQNQIQIGKQFSSTQFVRDYLERPQVYRVSYEDVKLKVKQSMEAQKLAYEKKKEQLTKAIKRQKALESQLQHELDQLKK